MPIRLHEDASSRCHAATVKHHRDQLLALTQSAASWRAPLAPLSKTG